MSDIWFISDTHFNHTNILSFTDNDGNRFRGSVFKDVDDMNEIMIQNWNNHIKPNDKVYHLGDVYFGQENAADKILSRLNGNKRLVLGNHDKITKQSVLLNHFQKIIMWWPFEGMIFSHVPLPIEQMKTRKGEAMNFHGHIHQNKSPTKRHFNLSVENINYTPMHLDEILKIRNNVS